MTTTTNQKKSAREIVVDRLLEKINTDQILPWKQTWVCRSMPYNYVTKRAYRGLNVLLLWALGIDYTDRGYMTFKQAKALGGTVKKGAKGYPVLFASPQDYPVLDENGKHVFDEFGQYKTKTVWIHRYYTVFNKEQVEGLLEEEQRAILQNHSAEKIISALGADIRPTSDPAYYPRADYVTCPPMEQFESDAAYYAALFHELVHWTGAEGRCDRKLLEHGGFGTDRYSEEELVAEIGASFLMAECGIWNETEENNAAYVQGWLKSLNNDRMMILRAASQAQKAVDYILSFSAKAEQTGNGMATAE